MTYKSCLLFVSNQNKQAKGFDRGKVVKSLAPKVPLNVQLQFIVKYLLFYHCEVCYLLFLMLYVKKLSPDLIYVISRDGG